MDAHSNPVSRPDSLDKKSRDSKWVLAGGFIGAILASTCCLGPLLLIIFGASGAWIGNLTAMKAYQPYFVGIALMFLAIGFWQLYKPVRVDCDDDKLCARPKVLTLQRSLLWVATVLVALATTIDWWAPLFY